MTANKILALGHAIEVVSQWHDNKETIVFTNGCFDIIHLGHIDYLEKASMKGSKMVVGINSDESVKRLKGNSRPITSEESRTRLMAAFEFVDAVVVFSEDTPLKLIETLKPNVLVKGSDYLTENIVGADFVIKNGGKVETIEWVEGYSTSNIINKIKGK